MSIGTITHCPIGFTTGVNDMFFFICESLKVTEQVWSILTQSWGGF